MSVKIMMALKSLLTEEMNLRNKDLLDGQADGKISGSIWNQFNPGAPIDENGFKDVDEALAEKRAAILEQYGITEEELQTEENRLKVNKLETIKKDLELINERREKPTDGDISRYGLA